MVAIFVSSIQATSSTKPQSVFAALRKFLKQLFPAERFESEEQLQKKKSPEFVRSSNSTFLFHTLTNSLTYSSSESREKQMD